MSKRAGLIWLAVLLFGLIILFAWKYFPKITWLLIPLVLILPLYSLISKDSGYEKSDENQ